MRVSWSNNVELGYSEDEAVFYAEFVSDERSKEWLNEPGFRCVLVMSIDDEAFFVGVLSPKIDKELAAKVATAYVREKST